MTKAGYAPGITWVRPVNLVHRLLFRCRWSYLLGTLIPTSIPNIYHLVLTPSG
jgi:hypothetical protein